MTRKALTMTAALAGGMMVAAPAMAGDFSFGLGIGVGRHGTSVNLGIATGRPQPVIVQPAAVVQPVAVAPVYREVVERVWVPLVETRYRDVPVLDALGQVIAYRREAYTVESGHWSEVRRQVPVPVPNTCLPTAVVGGGSMKKPYAAPHNPRLTPDRGINPGSFPGTRTSLAGGIRTNQWR